jgi:hypothetical protein
VRGGWLMLQVPQQGTAAARFRLEFRV